MGAGNGRGDWRKGIRVGKCTTAGKSRPFAPASAEFRTWSIFPRSLHSGAQLTEVARLSAFYVDPIMSGIHPGKLSGSVMSAHQVFLWSFRRWKPDFQLHKFFDKA